MGRRPSRVALTLLCAATTLLVPSPSFAAPSPIAIRVDAPAVVGMPIWIHADLAGPLVVRYPYDSDPHYFGSNQLEVKRDGQPLKPIAGEWQGGLVGMVVGSAAPPGSPQGRLPLHLGFAIDRPGRYSVRWTVEGGMSKETLAQSDWLDFDVRAASPRNRDAWLRSLLASPPTDAGAFVGDFLPSLLAAADDPRVVRALLDATHSSTTIVSSYAPGGLRTVPAEVAVPLTLEHLRRRGPSSGLAYFLAWRASLFRDHGAEILGIAAHSLQSPDDGVVVGALQTIGFAGHFDLSRTAPAVRDANAVVAAAAPALMTRGPRVVNTLASTLGGLKDTAARAPLWQLVERLPEAREQALAALTWIHDPQDLPRMANLLIQPGDSDPRGSRLSTLVYHLVTQYGDAATPFIERALAESPYVFVRTQAAEQLALKGSANAFRFFLDAIQSNALYRGELQQWLIMQFQLPRSADQAAFVAFLNAQIANPQMPPASPTEPIKAAVQRLKSPDAATRNAAAQTLLDLERQSTMYRTSVSADIVNDIIRTEAGAVSPEAWRDGALILGRMHANAAGTLLVYMERDGATAALIALGEPAVPEIIDVLKVGGPVRRRLAADVLGAIGGEQARTALVAASRSETDSSVRQAIQAALRHLRD